MSIRDKRRAAAIRKELQLVLRQEERRKAAAQRGRPARWKQELEQKLPEKVYAGLQSAFGKAFSLVFRKGGAILEKSYRKEERLSDHRVDDYVLRHRGQRVALRRMRKTASRANLGNLAITTVEGVGLGALGIGLPDIVLFITMLLRGIYETALSYGFSYDTTADTATPVINFIGFSQDSNFIRQGLNLYGLAKLLDFDIEDSTVTVGLTLVLQSLYFAGYRVKSAGKIDVPKGSILAADNTDCMRFVAGDLLNLAIKPLDLGELQGTDCGCGTCECDCNGNGYGQMSNNDCTKIVSDDTSVFPEV